MNDEEERMGVQRMTTVKVPDAEGRVYEFRREGEGVTIVRSPVRRRPIPVENLRQAMRELGVGGSDR